MGTEDRLTTVKGEGDYGLGETGKGITRTHNPLIDMDNSVVITRGREVWGQVEGAE